ncbi:MAG: RimK family alpha-L-glutamate ligase [Myxococcales bacterium]|nr:RimK family alpha-L-glutamate ligase [Myxococcales bacterium]
MKIGILSRSDKNPSVRRLIETCERRGHEAAVYDTLKFNMLIERGRPSLTYRNQAMPALDAIIPRIGASVTFFGLAVVRQFEQMGVYTLNTSHSIGVSRDKLRASQTLSRHNIGIPPTAFVRDRSGVLPAIEAVGGTPVIIKLLVGTQGIGVILADTVRVAEAIIETLQSKQQSVLIQKFVAESKGKDVRAFVVGDRVIAAVRRQAKGDEFRSNVHRGGVAELVQLDEQYERTAIRAAQILGLHVAGVDMLEGADGPLVMEVNSSPGINGMESVTNADLAMPIIEMIEEHVQFPAIDLRQRLTLAKGYGVAEVPVGPGSPLADKTIIELDLRARDVLVLSIQRGSVMIPTPGGDERLLPGDGVLCYGKRATLRALAPRRAIDPEA